MHPLSKPWVRAPVCRITTPLLTELRLSQTSSNSRGSPGLTGLTTHRACLRSSWTTSGWNLLPACWCEPPHPFPAAGVAEHPLTGTSCSPCVSAVSNVLQLTVAMPAIDFARNAYCVCDFWKEGWGHLRARVSFVVAWNWINSSWNCCKMIDLNSCFSKLTTDFVV